MKYKRKLKNTESMESKTSSEVGNMHPKEMIHYLISENLSGPQMGAAEALRGLLHQGLCLEKDHSLWPAAGTSAKAILKRSKMFRLNQELFHFRLNGSLSDSQLETQSRLLAELGSKAIPVKSSHFMIIMALVELYMQELCDSEVSDYDDLIHRLDNIEENIFFEEEMPFDLETSDSLLRVLHFFRSKAYWREDLQYTLQYKLAHTYWLCAAHLNAVNSNTHPLPMWEPFSEIEVAEAIDRIVDFIEANPEFMVIC